MAQSITNNTNDDSRILSVIKAAQQSGFGDIRDVLTLGENVSVPRTDVAGIVVAIGSGVKRLRVDDKVYGDLVIHGGSYAKYIRGDESLFTMKPNNLTMEEAAAVPLACDTSYQALFKKASPPIGTGSKILICGGSTTTDFYAIQLAKAVGAYVTVTCSQRNFSLMEKLGYTITQTNIEINNDQNQLHIIDYNEKDFGEELKNQNYDLVYGCVGGGQFITIVGDDTSSVISLKTLIIVGLRIVNRKFWSVFGSAHHGYIRDLLNENFQDLDDSRTKYIETGKVKPLIDAVFDWRKDGVEALYSLYEKFKSGKAQGKLILKIADEE
ncbi:unnamed protein product [Rotaria sordida]|uniref:Enoyl reductase (ER) domain-containing protein n=1 Tax=Rotaria sordida TaxID=392033 RepID=A0A819L5K9_9BILA|nr:unnamed protein product [Rotaria sordida]